MVACTKQFFEWTVALKGSPTFQPYVKMTLMQHDCRVTLIEPAVIKRTGNMETVIDLTTRLEDEIGLDTGLHLEMFARYDTDSSFMRLNEFFYPINVQVRVMMDGTKKSVARTCVSFWKRNSDSRCLVMVNSNLAEDTFEGSYEDALTWAVNRVNEKLR